MQTRAGGTIDGIISGSTGKTIEMRIFHAAGLWICCPEGKLFGVERLSSLRSDAFRNLPGGRWPECLLLSVIL